MCETDITRFILNCFDTASIPSYVNETLVTLIPKVANPMRMTQLRPISLCNTLYKVISKIIVNRLRPMLDSIINPAQASYIPGRQISDNIIVVQEVLSKFKKCRGNKGYLAWKVDLSKAYDRLN